MDRKPEKSDLPPTILESFDVYTEPEHWEIHCPHCKARWELKRTMHVSVGNTLYLLNHARGHQEAA